MRIKEISNMIRSDRLQWKGHALRRMLERDISREEVKNALLNGEVIEEYKDDFPFQSCLFLGFIKKKPIHIVCALAQDFLWIITAYYPDPHKWQEDFKSRR
ncbi:MAG: DUF4258 domain-containing protein [Pseudomonadota bacterium]